MIVNGECGKNLRYKRNAKLTQSHVPTFGKLEGVFLTAPLNQSISSDSPPPLLCVDKHFNSNRKAGLKISQCLHIFDQNPPPIVKNKIPEPIF